MRVEVTASFGISSTEGCTNPDLVSVARLIEEADRALYAAKRHGRNRVVAYVPTLVSNSELHASYESQPPLVA